MRVAIPACALVAALAQPASADDQRKAEYLPFLNGGTLGLPTNSAGASLAVGGGTAGLNLGALVKGGVRVTDSLRLFVVAEPTQLTVASMSQIDTSVTSVSYADVPFSTLSVRLSGGRRPPSEADKSICCPAVARGTDLVAGEVEACQRLGVPPVKDTSCPVFEKPSKLYWGVGAYVMTPGTESGPDGVGGAFDAYVEYHSNSTEFFVSVAGVGLQDWSDSTAESTISRASTVDGRISAGYQYQAEAVYVGGLGHAGCQQWKLGDRDSKACYFDAGLVVIIPNIPKIHRLTLFVGASRAAGADNRKMLDDEYRPLNVVARLSPAVTF